MEKADDFYSSDEDDTQSSTTASEIGGPKFKVFVSCAHPPKLVYRRTTPVASVSCITQAAIQIKLSKCGRVSCAWLHPTGHLMMVHSGVS